MKPAEHAPEPLPDISEKGRGLRGEVITMDRRLFMQLLAFGNCHDTAPVIAALAASGITATLYADINDPWGVALLSLSDDPDFFVGPLRRFLQASPFRQ